VPCYASHTVDAEYLGEAGPEMEFLDVNLTKDSSLLLHAIHSPFLLYSGLKKNIKKIRETRKLEFVHEKHSVERKNEGRKPDKNPSLRRLELFKNSISGVMLFSGQEDTC
jgi:hypothetical protein